MPDIAKRVLNRGEIDPLARGLPNNSELISQGLAKARNVYVHRLGGVSNRAGTRYRAPVRHHDKATRLIPFKFGDEDTHFVELGDEYARFTRNGSHIFDIEKNISAVTKASPVEVTTSASHGFSTGDEVEIQGVVGMTELNNRRFRVTSTGATTFTLTDQLTGVAVDSTSFDTYASGGTVSRVYTIVSPYDEADLFKIKYKQSYDVLTLTCEGYPAKELKRAGLTSWSFDDVLYAPDHSAPTALAVSVGTAGAVTYRYAVTAVSAESGEESLPGLGATATNITGVTKANPAVVTFSGAPGYETGHEIEISGVGGMTELNSKRFRVAKVTSTTYQLQGIDSTNFTTYTSGGSAKPAFVVAASAATTANNTLTWTAVNGTIEYNIYREKNGVFGYLASTGDATFKDDGSIAPDVTDSAPYFRDPFIGAGNYPLAVGRYQQRNVYGGTTNSPSKMEFSRIGARKNLSSSNPIKIDDAFSATLDGDEVNKIRHIVTGRDLMVFTNTAVHIVNSTSESGFGFSTMRQQQQADVGSSDVRPLSVEKWVLFDEDQGVRVNAIQYRFTIDGYAPEDISYPSAHFFKNDRIVDWTYVSWPEPIIYAVTEAGYCLCFTFSPQEELRTRGWTRLETDGFFKSVASIREYPNDRQESVMFLVQRGDYTFMEVMDFRNFTQVEDCYFLDGGTTFEQAQVIESVSGDTYTITGHGWVDGDVLTGPDRRYYTVASATTDTFDLVGAGYAAGDILRLRRRDIDGLYHLAGKTVVALLDGNVERGLTVDENGRCTLPYSSARTHIGIGYTATIHSLPVGNDNVEYGGKLKKLSSVKIDVLDSRGFHMGIVDGALMSPWKQREFEGYGEPTQLFTGFVDKTVDSTWTREGKIAIEQRDPLPLTIRAFVPNVVS